MVNSYKSLMDREKKGTYPELWDGHAAERIVEILASVKSSGGP